MQKLRIGTRESELAVYQATLVQQQLLNYNIQSELIFIKSEGDIDLITPLYALGVQGVFTKTLDAALLNNRIDIAVHSMKDVPTQLASGIVQAAVLQRANTQDILVLNTKQSKTQSLHDVVTIGTGSVRRKAQWLHKFPQHNIDNLRGNVNTRLQKTQQHNWYGAIFAMAGLERLNKLPEHVVLDWMIPAPAQGAIMVVCRTEDEAIQQALLPLNHAETALCTSVERNFLKALMGGCSTPIGALAKVENNEVHFSGNVLSVDGKQMVDIHRTIPLSNCTATWGIELASEIMKLGADTLIQQLKNGQAN